MKKTLVSAAIAATLLGSASTAMAYEAGDFIVRAGAAQVNPHDSMSTGSTLDAVNAGVDNDTQLGITAAYMVTDTVGVELLAATPFTHTISTDLGNADTKHLPPTVSLQYYPKLNSALQPYVGVGVNYTAFFDTDDLAGQELKLKDSWGVAFQAGVDYALSDNFLLNASVWNVDIDAKATLDGADIGTAEIDPWVYMVGVGYKF